MDKRRLRASEVALLLAGAMCIVPFLQPRHMPPLPAFYDEWLAFALGSASLAIFGLSRRDTHAGLPVPALLLGGFAIFLAGRAVLMQPAYFQSALVWMIYAAFAGGMLTLGRGLANDLGRDRVCEVIASFILAGAMLNAVCAALQIVGIPSTLSAFVSHLQGNRATGNIGQANLFANYIALGEASVAYLYARGRIEAVTALACGAVLVLGAALAASRASFLYAAGFALLGFLVMRARPGDAQARRLGVSACVIGVCVFAAQWLLPYGLDLLGYRSEGGILRHAPPSADGLSSDEASNLRIGAWALAWRVFLTVPWLGAGPDEFPGAAFALGLPPDIARGMLWTSPHNMVLHLASETGLSGLALVLAAVLVWLRESLRTFIRSRDAASWWLLGCVGVELLHALLEYPMWYAHFLALASLIMGVSLRSGILVRPAVGRVAAGITALAATLLLTVTLVAYFRFDLASPVAAGRSLASDPDIAKDRDTLFELGQGLLAPRAETWLFLSYPLDEFGLSQKIQVGRRVMRVWPSREVVGRQAIFLALARRDEEALDLMRRGVRNFAGHRRLYDELIASAPARARDTLRQALEEAPR
jgi:O-antigen ligase